MGNYTSDNRPEGRNSACNNQPVPVQLVGNYVPTISSKFKCHCGKPGFDLHLVKCKTKVDFDTLTGSNNTELRSLASAQSITTAMIQPNDGKLDSDVPWTTENLRIFTDGLQTIWDSSSSRQHCTKLRSILPSVPVMETSGQPLLAEIPAGKQLLPKQLKTLNLDGA
ncbi:hypothetical protein H2248_004346 [Termitomyces sp. 'cryptogamus']|nr:hypothetical protein H2248_004346 [Termitomyces sp. 'cryptogamus']